MNFLQSEILSSHLNYVGLVFGQPSGHPGTLDLIEVHSSRQVGEGLLL